MNQQLKALIYQVRPKSLANHLLKILLLQRHAHNSSQGISQPCMIGFVTCMIGFVTWPPFTYNR